MKTKLVWMSMYPYPETQFLYLMKRISDMRFQGNHGHYPFHFQRTVGVFPLDRLVRRIQGSKLKIPTTIHPSTVLVGRAFVIPVCIIIVTVPRRDGVVRKGNRLARPKQQRAQQQSCQYQAAFIFHGFHGVNF